MIGAVEAKVVAALTVRDWDPAVPRIVLPLAVKVLEVLLSVTLPVKDARPLLSIMRRSVGWLLLTLVLPVPLVLSIRLPPKLPVASCMANGLIQATLHNDRQCCQVHIYMQPTDAWQHCSKK